jgi:thioredoxin-like negative regulator of GroEL
MIRSRGSRLALAALIWLVGAGAALAFQTKPYDAAAFKAAQAAGAPVLVHVFAPWCPTCAAQEKVLGTLKDKPDYDKVTIFKVDYDNQPDVVQGFGARSQSTLVAFKGGKETGRSVGDTSASSIESLLGTLK